MTASTAVAQLVPVLIEKPAFRHGKPSYVWRPGVKVVTPEGQEMQPYMGVREARAFCKQQGWTTQYGA